MEPGNGQYHQDPAPQSAAISNSFREITLRQVVEDDMPFLFRLFADPGRSHLWMQARRIFDEREFHQAWIRWASDMMGAKFLVASGERPIGLVFEYDRALEDGHTKVTALLQEESVGRGAGAIAAALLWRWLFQSLPLRKIYMEVYGYNPAVAAMLRKLGLVEEAVLKQHRFFNGACWDLHVFALYREAGPEVCDRILRLPRQAARRATEGLSTSASPATSNIQRVGKPPVPPRVPSDGNGKEVNRTESCV